MEQRFFGEKIRANYQEYTFVFTESRTWDRKWRIFVRCFRYDEPTNTHSDIPVMGWYNPEIKSVVFPLYKKSSKKPVPKHVIKAVSEFLDESFFME